MRWIVRDFGVFLYGCVFACKYIVLGRDARPSGKQGRKYGHYVRTVTACNLTKNPNKFQQIRTLRRWQISCTDRMHIRQRRVRLYMSSLSLDIFKKDVQGNPIWLDAVGDLDAARLRLRQLASVIPGEYFAFDQNIHQIVVNVVRSDSDRIGG